MHENVRFPITITITPRQLEILPTGCGFSTYPENNAEYSLREVPLDGGRIGITFDGELVHLGVNEKQLATTAPLKLPSTIDVDGSVTTMLEFGCSATISSTIDEVRDVVTYEVRLGDNLPDRTVRLSSGLIIGLVEETLCLLAYETAVRHPIDRRIRIVAQEWHTQAHDWFALDAAPGGPPSGVSVSLLARSMVADEPPPLPAEGGPLITDGYLDWSPPETWEQIPSLDGTNSMLLNDGELLSLDVNAELGAVCIPRATETADTLELTLAWPGNATATYDDRDDETACVQIDFAGDPIRWVEVGNNLIVGITKDEHLAALVLPSFNSKDSYDTLIDSSLTLAFDPAAMHTEVMASIDEQHARDLATADRYIAERPFAAYGPTPTPHVESVSMHLIDPVFGAGHAPVGIQLTWGDEMRRTMQDGDPTARFISVRHERIVDETIPPEMRTSNEDLHWLCAEQMRREAEHTAPEDLIDIASSSVFDTRAYNQSIDTLAQSAAPCMVTVDGVDHGGTAVRTAAGFIAYAEHDGRRWTIRSNDTTNVIPELTIVDDLTEARTGLARVQEGMSALHEKSRHAGGTRGVPTAATAFKGECETVLMIVRLYMTTPMDPVSAFSQEIVDSWGGADLFRSRFDVLRHMTNINTHVVAVDQDTSVAFAFAAVSLPRPRGGGVGMMFMNEPGWWEHSTADVRSAASVILEPDQQEEFDLQVNLLLERMPDQRVVIATDILRIIDKHVGGIERLLTPRHQLDS